MTTPQASAVVSPPTGGAAASDFPLTMAPEDAGDPDLLRAADAEVRVTPQGGLTVRVSLDTSELLELAACWRTAALGADDARFWALCEGRASVFVALAGLIDPAAAAYGVELSARNCAGCV